MSTLDGLQDFAGNHPWAFAASVALVAGVTAYIQSPHYKVGSVCNDSARAHYHSCLVAPYSDCRELVMASPQLRWCKPVEYKGTGLSAAGI
jgi:hypothetical protein